jgi:hypothetical protein
MGNKQEKCVAAGTTSGAAALGGVALMVFGGPVGVVAGAAIMSGGIGGVTNSISQAKDPKAEDFSLKKFAGHVAVNGVVGGVTGGVGTAVQTAGRAAQITAIVATSSVGSGTAQVAGNKIDGKEDIYDGLGTALLAGGVAGGVAGASGKWLGEVA